MEDRRIKKCVVPDLALECVMPYIDDPRDRLVVSLVCTRWRQIDASTRKHITIALSYSTTPELLMRRFPHQESLKLKGQHRAAKYNHISENWGGYAGPWIRADGFPCMKSLHFRRMIVTDEDLNVLDNSRGHMLHTLKLDNCSGFFNTGLLHVAHYCRCLKTFFLEESSIEPHDDGEWLHVLALNNTTLETLNFYLTDLSNINVRDLELMAKKCCSLVFVKIGESEIVELINSSRMQLYWKSSVEVTSVRNQTIDMHSLRLCSLGLSYMRKDPNCIVFKFPNTYVVFIIQS